MSLTPDQAAARAAHPAYRPAGELVQLPTALSRHYLLPDLEADLEATAGTPVLELEPWQEHVLEQELTPAVAGRILRWISDHADELEAHAEIVTLAELGQAGSPCHLCGVRTPWELPRVGSTCDTCSPLVLGALDSAYGTIRCQECRFVTRDGYLAGEHEDETGHRTDGEQ